MPTPFPVHGQKWSKRSIVTFNSLQYFARNWSSGKFLLFKNTFFTRRPSLRASSVSTVGKIPGSVSHADNKKYNDSVHVTMQNKCVSIDTPSMTMNQADVGITIPRNDSGKQFDACQGGSSAPQVVRLYDPMLCSSTLRRRDVSMMSKHIVTCLPSGSSLS